MKKQTLVIQPEYLEIIKGIVLETPMPHKVSDPILKAIESGIAEGNMIDAAMTSNLERISEQEKEIENFKGIISAQEETAGEVLETSNSYFNEMNKLHDQLAEANAYIEDLKGRIGIVDPEFEPETASKIEEK